MAMETSEPLAQLAQAASVTPSYRRNGKLFSCEPCRRGKLRCDHTSPVCGRCARRKKPEQCIYHPAPLTKPRQSSISGVSPIVHPRASPRPRPSAPHPYPVLVNDQSQQQHQASPQQQHIHHRQQSSGLMSPPTSTEPHIHRELGVRSTTNGSISDNSVLHSPATISQVVPALVEDNKTTPSSIAYTNNESGMSFRDTRMGFLGATSYSAVYTENSNIIETLETTDSPALPAIQAEKIQQGANVLSMLSDIPVYRKLLQRYFDICDGIVVLHPVFRIWVDELWKEFGSILTAGQPDQMRALSELVWHNTRRPLKVHGNMTARGWARSASGRNLRWEVVGNILSMVGLVAVNTDNWDAMFESIREQYVERAVFAERMRKASEYCLCFCYESEVLNEIYVCFMYEDLVLVECLKGDAHYAAWQRTGEVCDAIVALGLHQGNRPDADTPFWLAEFRKKIFVSAYGRDKTVASFLGRPPRLSYRYCKMEEPLDLSDMELCAEGAELEGYVAKLDANGWNTIGNVHRTTWTRVWFQHCRIREDILELALGSGEEDITWKVQQIRQRMDRAHATFPSFMMVQPEEFFEGHEMHRFGTNERALRQVTGIFVLCIHTGLIHTEFLLQRALLNRTRADTKQLIPISRRMLKLVLMAQTKRTEHFRDFPSDVSYLLAFHGLPAAGVLAVEMLKQEQTRQYTPDILPRSETIQDLSVFVSALAAVNPGEGNFSVCDQGRRALRRVLDQILSPVQPIPPPASSGEQAIFDDSNLYFPTGGDADFLQWLDNVEWDKNNWIDAPPQSAHAEGNV